MRGNILFFSAIILMFMAGCSIGNHKNMDNEPIRRISLTGSCSEDYLFNVYSDKKLEIVSARSVLFQDETKMFNVSEIAGQIEFSLTQEQFDSLIDCIDGFIDENLDEIAFMGVDPAFNFNVVVASREIIKKMDGTACVSVDENWNPIQTEMTSNLMLVLHELSPVPIIFVRVPY